MLSQNVDVLVLDFLSNKETNFFCLFFIISVWNSQSKESQVHPTQDVYLEAMRLCSCE